MTWCNRNKLELVIQEDNIPKSTLYYEAHLTIDPCFQQEELDQFTSHCKLHKFHVAKLFMQKGVPSNLDQFCTGRSKSLEDLKNRLTELVMLLEYHKFVVRRFKIESTVFDSKLSKVIS